MEENGMARGTRSVGSSYHAYDTTSQIVLNA